MKENVEGFLTDMPEIDGFRFTGLGDLSRFCRQFWARICRYTLIVL